MQFIPVDSINTELCPCTNVGEKAGLSYNRQTAALSNRTAIWSSVPAGRYLLGRQSSLERPTGSMKLIKIGVDQSYRYRREESASLRLVSELEIHPRGRVGASPSPTTVAYFGIVHHSSHLILSHFISSHFVSSGHPAVLSPVLFSSEDVFSRYFHSVLNHSPDGASSSPATAAKRLDDRPPLPGSDPAGRVDRGVLRPDRNPRESWGRATP